MPNGFFKSGSEKKQGFYDGYSDIKVVLVQWNDNQVVSVTSNFVGVQPMKAVQRFLVNGKKEILHSSASS